ncbi:uncharacterized protein [Haliotis cracherodii]|uniref:uncharacterized protein n=1 Tax=Haliotis cracherodii TaxID=6455 RepID=UPI0039E95B9E
MTSLFRCAGDVVFDHTAPRPGSISSVQLKQYSETCNFLQYLKPLTPQQPCFFAQIRGIAQNSKITLGIAGPDIEDDAHPGNWNNSVGYHSDTGKCYTSHNGTANTDGEKFGIGDEFGVLVTYFGSTMSTVTFLKNGQPVATRYLFETNHSHFLPTIALENGPIDLGLMWPETVVGVPEFTETNMLHWIRPSIVQYSIVNNMFVVGKDAGEPNIIQSPRPLRTGQQHFEVIVQETTREGRGPGITLATCSPLKPTPICSLSSDFLMWQANGKNCKVMVGQHIGWGVHYNPLTRDLPGFDCRAEQLVLCYVSMDTRIGHYQMMLQPAGGFYPVVVLYREASKVTVDVESNPMPSVNDKLDEAFLRLMEEAKRTLASAAISSEIILSMFRKSDALQVLNMEKYSQLRLPAEEKGIHVIQLQKPFNTVNRSYVLEIRRLNEDSVVSFGVAGSSFPLKKLPGKCAESVGWVSRDGRLYANEKNQGNMPGERFCEGDTVSMEISSFAKEMSVCLFSKNSRAIGTRYYTEGEMSEHLPTIAVCGNGYDVEIHVYWQTQILSNTSFGVTNADHWCLPSGSKVDQATCRVNVRDHISPVALQAPYSLNRGYNHFEIKIIDKFDDDSPPPALALSTASPFDPPPQSNFKQDFLRFWATGEARDVVQKGDLVGWGLLYLDNTLEDHEEQLVICYLTVNRNMVLTRVIYQPPGGFYPLVILPPGVNHVQLDFSASIIQSHPFTKQAVDILVKEAKQLIDLENSVQADGGDLDDLDIKDQLFKPLPDIPEDMPTEKYVEPGKEEKTPVVQPASVSNQAPPPPNFLPAPQERGFDPIITQGNVREKVKRRNSKRSRNGDEAKSKSCTIL